MLLVVMLQATKRITNPRLGQHTMLHERPTGPQSMTMSSSALDLEEALWQPGWQLPGSRCCCSMPEMTKEMLSNSKFPLFSCNQPSMSR
jgi:hypothetical protein